MEKTPLPPKQMVYQAVERGIERQAMLNDILFREFGQLCYGQFQNAVDMFMKKRMEAPPFIRICRQYLEHRFDELFEEFIVLLGDISLQGKLYQCIGSPTSLIPCIECSQILRKADLVYHTQHYHDTSLTKYFVRT